MTFGLKRNYFVNNIMSKSEILNINQMPFKEIKVLMFKQNIGKNPSVFLNVLNPFSNPSLTTHKLFNILLFCSCGGAEIKEN